MRSPEMLQNLQSLQVIPWVAVIDFDPASEKDGLYHCIVKQTVHGVERRQPVVLHSDDCQTFFADRGGYSEKSQALKAAHQLSWIFANGRDDGMEREESFDGWFGTRKKEIDIALIKLKEQFSHLIVVFTVFSKESIKEMATLIESVYSQFGMQLLKRIVVVCENQETIDTLRSNCKIRRIDECFITGLPWATVVDTIKTMQKEVTRGDLGGSKCLLTSSPSTKPVRVPPKKLDEWKGLSVLDYDEDKRKYDDEQTKRIRDDFYRGYRVSWLNFKLRHDVERDMTMRVKQRTLDMLNERRLRLSNDPLMSRRYPTGLVTILHQPGTGGSTLARRVMWELRHENCRCVVIEGIDGRTSQHLQDIQYYGEDRKNLARCLPLLLCYDGEDLDQFRDLVCNLDRLGVRSVIINVKALSRQDDAHDRMSGNKSTFRVPTKLKDSEVTQVKRILSVLCRNEEQLSEMVAAASRDRHLFYFGLRLFGEEYNKEKLQKFVTSRLDAVSHIECQMLRFCSFVYNYRHMSIPRLCFRSIFVPVSVEEKIPFDIESIGPSSVELILEVQELTETSNYWGWRPAHPRVGELILKGEDIVAIALDFLTTMLRGSAHATKYLQEVACELFAKRMYVAKDDWYNEYDEVATDFYSSEQTSDQTPEKSPSRPTRHSQFIAEVLEQQNGKETALVLWFTLCTYVRNNPYAWQHFARFLAYEYKGSDLPLVMSHNVSRLLDRDITPANYDSLELEGTVDVRQAYLSESEEAKRNRLETDGVGAMTGFTCAMRCIKESHSLKAGTSAFYSTEGLIHKLCLDAYRNEVRDVESMEEAIAITQRAASAFNQAQECRQNYRNWYPLVGEIQVGLMLLDILRQSSFFEKRYRARGPSSFESFIYGETDELPHELRLLTSESAKFLKGLVAQILQLLHSVFEHEASLHADRSSEEAIRRRWHLAIVEASSLRTQFYKILAMRAGSLLPQERRWEKNNQMREMISDGLLKEHGESPFSSWKGLQQRHIQQLIRLLKPVALQRRHKVSCSTMVVLLRACIEAETDIPPLAEVVHMVHDWCTAYPQSEWAFMFRGMIHFPIPQGNRVADRQLVNESLKSCGLITRNKPFGFKRARPRYFVGRKEGINGLLPYRDIASWDGHLERHRTEGMFLTSADWWRSNPVWDKLARLEGTRQAGRSINYKGIHVRMDTDPSPRSEGRDRLWFCLGFTVQGPVAFDPIDEDMYKDLCEKEHNHEIPEFEGRLAFKRDGLKETTAKTPDSPRGKSFGHVSPSRKKGTVRLAGDLNNSTTTRDSTRLEEVASAATVTQLSFRPDDTFDIGDKTLTQSPPSDLTDGLCITTHDADTNDETTSMKRVNGRKPPPEANTIAASNVDEERSSLMSRLESGRALYDQYLPHGTSGPVWPASERGEPERSRRAMRLELADDCTHVRPGDTTQTLQSETDDNSDWTTVLKRRGSRQHRAASGENCELYIGGIAGLTDADVKSRAVIYGKVKFRRPSKDYGFLSYDSRQEASVARKDLSLAFAGHKVTVEWTRKQNKT